MKKIYLFLIGMLSAQFISADNNEDILQVTPQVIEAGYTENDYDEDHRFSVQILCDADEFTALQFDMYLPEGLTILTDVLDLDDNRFDGKIIKKVWTPYATTEITDKGNGHYLVTLYDSDLNKIHGTDGPALYFYYLTTPDVNNSLLPIVMKNIWLTRPDETSVTYDAATSYLICGTPTNESLAVEGVLPSFVTTALNKETTISYLDISKATTINGTLAPNDVLVAGASSSTYTRKVGADNYATVCLPMAQEGTFYTVKTIGDNYITLKESNGLAANVPGIIKGDINASAAEYVTLLNSPVTGDGGLEGTYGYFGRIGCYYLSGNKFYHDYASVKPFRAYIPSSGGAKILNIYIEDATGIHEITDQLSNEDIYTLQGIRVNNAQKGVNIIGGKKVYNK